MNQKELKKFAVDTKVGIKVAKKILERLEKKGLKAEDLSTVMRRIKDRFVENNYNSFLKKISPKVLDQVIDNMILRRMGVNISASSRKNGNKFGNRIAKWIFSKITHKKYKAGDKVEIQIMRVGERDHYEYGKVKITAKTIANVTKNFNSNALGQQLPVDENHEPDTKALGWYEKLYSKTKSDLYATIELTRVGAKLLTDGAYRYFSPEYYDEYDDEENGTTIKDLLTGGAFTNRPYFKGMDPILASETGATTKVTKSTDPEFFILQFNGNMNKLKKILMAFTKTNKVTQEEKDEAALLFSQLPEAKRTPRLIAQFSELQEHTDEDPSDEPGADDDADDDSADDGGDDADDGADAADDLDEDEEDEDLDDDEEDDEDEDADEDDEDEDEDDDEDEDPDPKKKKTHSKKTASKKMSVDEMEYKRTKRMAQKYRKLRIQATKDKVTKNVEGLMFSDKNKKAIVMPAAKDKVVAFAMSLSSNKRKVFMGLLKGMTITSKIFGEIGHSDKSELTGADELDRKTKEHMDAFNGNNPNKEPMTYSQALKIVAPTVKMAEEK